MRILMCPPDHFDVLYKINPWMAAQAVVDKPLAAKQWLELKSTIESLGAKVDTMAPAQGLPDLVFTANAALVLPDGAAFLAHFFYAERQPEREHYKQWFVDHDFVVTGDAAADYQNGQYAGLIFEGAGDALFVGDFLFAGYGIRTNKSAYDLLSQHGVKQTLLCELVTQDFYHIDTCFCPLDENQAIWYPAAFSAQSQQRMLASGIKLHAVTEADAKRFACNAVVINDNVIMAEGAVETPKLLNQLGFKVHQVAMSEFLKAGGSCKCLTLRVE